MNPYDTIWYHAGVRAFVTRAGIPNRDASIGYAAASDNAAVLGLVHVRVDELKVGDVVIAVFSRQLGKRTVASITPSGPGTLTLRFEEAGSSVSPRGRSAHVLRAPAKPPKLKRPPRGGPFDWMFR